ncbi:MAG TPA: AsmA-like C-terminal region-containing protein, partial [Usitatibacter sp.]|nr:AsmA-like C-terminal region-containing protein [Usitatibacter sp.]
EAEARAKAETEARIRAEEETKRLRAQAEEQAKKAEEQLRKAQAEAAAAASAAAGAAAAAAAKAKQEAEARAREAVVAAEAKAKQEAEARAKVQADADARVRKEAEERARVQAEAEKQVQAERQAKYEAEARAKIDAEEREKRERALSANLEAARKEKEEAEQRAKAEARARETVEADTRAKVQAELETDLAKKAEIEGKAQAKAYMEAKVKAEQEEDERMRQEQARRAQEIAAVLRTKVEPDSVAPEEGGAPARKRTYRRKGNLVRNVAFALVGGLVLAVVAVHVIPMRGLTVKVEKALSSWLNDDVTIAATTFRLIPSPHLNIQNLGVGKALEAKAITGRIYVDLGSLLSDKVSISSVELDNVTIGSEAVAKILPVWSQANGKAETGINSIRLSGVNIDVRPAVEPFSAVLIFNRDGTFKSANLNAGASWSLGVRPAAEKGMDLDFNARNWKLPLGAPIPINDVRLKGTLAGNEIVVPEFEASAMQGKVNGTLKVSWAQGIKVESDLSVEKMSAGDLIKSFTKDIAVTGRFDGNFVFTTEGPNVEGLFSNPRVQGKFRLGEGSISNVDLVAVMQSDSAGTRAGVTKFNEVTGEFASVNRGASYRQVNLQGGVLRGNGQVDVGNNSSLSGRVNLEIRSQVAQDRGGFTVSGTVSRPIVRRGG